MSLVTSDNCPWCYLPSQPKERICRRCGHCARIPRTYCDCVACLADRPSYGTAPLKIFGDSVDRMVASLDVQLLRDYGVDADTLTRGRRPPLDVP